MKEFTGFDIDDLRTEDNFLSSALSNISHLKWAGGSRSPISVVKVIRSGKSQFETVYEFYLNKKNSISPPPRIDDRIEFLGIVKHYLFTHCDKRRKKPLFAYNEEDIANINKDNLPSAAEVFTQPHLLESTIANLWSSNNFLQKVVEGENLDEIINTCIFELDTVLKTYKPEESYSYSSKVNALWLYALENLDTNVFEEIRLTEDPSILYGFKGVQCEVKERRIFTHQNMICKRHGRNYKKILYYGGPDTIENSAIGLPFSDLLKKGKLVSDYIKGLT